MDIGMAIQELIKGNEVSRMGWNGKSQTLGMHRPDVGEAMTLPFIYITTVQGDRVPWLASQTDILACDWQTVPSDPATARLW